MMVGRIFEKCKDLNLLPAPKSRQEGEKMDYKVVMPYIGGVLSDNNYKFLNKGTKPIVNMWKRELAHKIEELDIPEAKAYKVEVFGRFTDERRPDVPNLFKVILDGLKKTKTQRGLGVDDKHIHPSDAGYELGFIDPVIEIEITPLTKTSDFLDRSLDPNGYYDCV